MITEGVFHPGNIARDHCVLPKTCAGDIPIYLFFRRPVRGYTYISIFRMCFFPKTCAGDIPIYRFFSSSEYVFPKTCNGDILYIYFPNVLFPKTCTGIYLYICFPFFFCRRPVHGYTYLFCRRPVRGYTYLSVFFSFLFLLPKTCTGIYLYIGLFFPKTSTGIYLYIDFSEDLSGDISIFPKTCTVI